MDENLTTAQIESACSLVCEYLHDLARDMFSIYDNLTHVSATLNTTEAPDIANEIYNLSMRLNKVEGQLGEYQEKYQKTVQDYKDEIALAGEGLASATAKADQKINTGSEKLDETQNSL